MISGWKTITAGCVLILTGLVKVVSGLQGLPETIDWASVKEGIEAVGAGLAVVGLGHKIDKSGIVNVQR